MSWLTNWRFRGSLRADPRSKSLVSIAQSLETLAAAARIWIYKEYGRDLDAPEPTRADLTREIWPPDYPDDEREAVQEEIARLRELEGADLTPAVPKSPRNAVLEANLRVGEPSGPRMSVWRSSEGDSEALTREEREFAAEIGDIGVGGDSD